MLQSTRILCLAGTLLGAAIGQVHATTATWTNTANGVVDYWTNIANWSSAQYPGQDNPNQNAFLTNRVNGAVYKAIVNAPLSYSLGTLEIKNLGANGEAWVIVTNAVLVETNLFVRSGGRLEIDSQGVVSNAPGFTIGLGFAMDGTNGQMLINSGGSLFASTNAIVGSSASGKSNLLSLGDSAVFAIANGSFTLGNTAGADGNRLLVTGNGVSIRTVIGVAIGAGSASNTAWFTGTGTVWNCGGSQLRVGQGGNYNTMMVSQGSLAITNHGTMDIGLGGANNLLIVTNGGRLYLNSRLGLGYNTATVTNNAAIVTGAGSILDMNARCISIGDAGGNFNWVLIDQGGTISNAYINVGDTSGGSAAYGNRFTITNGGRCWQGTATTGPVVGNWGSNDTATVTGNGSVWDLGTRALTVGSSGTNVTLGNTLRIDAGGIVTNGTVIVGGGASSILNTLAFSNGGSAFLGSLTVGAASSSNTVSIGPGCLLEANALTNGGVAIGNVFTNNGGVFQFSKVAPTIAPNGAGGIALTAGTIAFRAVTNVDVKGNWSGTQLTNITFYGNNTFRLNSATNATTPDQSYTFATGLGATNYTRLELYNGSMYRGGSVTIGNGGSLAASGAPSTITNLAILSGGALEVTLNGTNSVSQLTAVGSVALGGTLNLILAGPPPPAGYAATVIAKNGTGLISGQFGSSAVTALYQGTNYSFRVDSNAGDGNDLVLRSLGRTVVGTAILFR